MWTSFVDEANTYIGYIDDYNEYRSIACYAVGGVIILFGVLGLIGSIPCRKSVSVGFLRASVGLSFIFSWIFMLVVIVCFLLGGILTRYGCIPFNPASGDMSGLTYLNSKVDVQLEVFSDEAIQFDLNATLRSCQENKGFGEALGLKQLVDDFVDDQDVGGMIDEALSIINDTYDDLVADFNFEEYASTLEDFKVPDEINDLADSIETAKGPLDDLETKLNTPQLPESDDLNAIKNKIGVMMTSFDGIETTTTSLVAEAQAVNLDQIVAEMKNLENDLTDPESTIKNAIYDEASFVKKNTVRFVDEFADSLVNDFGRCQPVYQTYENVLRLLCAYAVDALNALWFALGWSVFFILVMIIFGHQLSLLLRHTDSTNSYTSKAKVAAYNGDF